jgi:DNA-binding Lrp family transcriptional regulator
MESLDLRLLRSLYLEERLNLEGTDPRCSILTLSQKTGVSRITVSRRLARWRADGFWTGQTVYPNPDAFGLRFQMQAILLEHGRDRPRLERAIREVLEPFLSFQVRDFYAPLLWSETPEETARRQKAFAKVCAARVVYPPFDVPFERSKIPLRPRDWRIIQALRRTTEPDWPRVAEEVRMSLRGLERRVEQLMEAKSLFFHPDLDFRKLPVSVAWVGLLHDNSTDARGLLSQVAKLTTDIFPVTPFFPIEMLIPAVDRPPAAGSVAFFAALPSGSSGDQLRRDLAELPGVMDILLEFPTQNVSFPNRLDRMIANEVERSPRSLAVAASS